MNALFTLSKFSHFLGDNGGLLLLGNHDLESIKVAQARLGLSAGQLLGPGTLLPGSQSISFFPGLGDGLLSSISLDLDSQVSQGDACKGDDLSQDASGGSLNEASVLIDNVNDGRQLALFRTVVNEDHTANFHVTLERHLAIGVLLKRGMYYKNNDGAIVVGGGRMLGYDDGCSPSLRVRA